MYKLEYLPIAKKDMVEIVQYISKELQNPEAAESLLTFPYSTPVYQPIRSL